MTIEQLQYFTAIVEHKTFSEAAVILNISQSALSKNIQKLELELGLSLFERSKRYISLTKFGEIFYQDTITMLNQYDTMKYHINQYHQEIHGTIRLTMLPILSQYNISGHLKHFVQENPNIKLIVDEMEDVQLLQELHNKNYDLAIIRKEGLPDDTFRTYPFATDELVLVTSLGHPFAKRDCVSLTELTEEAFILMNKHISIYSTCVEACQQYGFTPHVIRTARIESILSSVAAGHGISLLMKKNVAIFKHDTVAIIPLIEKIESTVVIASLKNKKLSSSMRLFIDSFVKSN